MSIFTSNQFFSPLPPMIVSWTFISASIPSSLKSPTPTGRLLNAALNRNRPCLGCSLVFLKLKYCPFCLILFFAATMSLLSESPPVVSLTPFVEDGSVSCLCGLQQTVMGFHNAITNRHCIPEDKYLRKLPIGKWLRTVTL